MGQKISIKLAGRTFNLTAASPEQEALFRNAAESVNSLYESYSRAYVGKNPDDNLALVAFNEAVGKLSLAEEKESLEKAQEALLKDLDKYLLGQ